MAEIIDLDDALPPDKKIRIGGEVFTLPGDIPTELFLRIQRATGSLEQDDGIENLYESIKELFNQRTSNNGKVPKVGLAQMVGLFAAVYGRTEEDGERPTRTRGTGTSSSRAKTKSPS